MLAGKAHVTACIEKLDSKSLAHLPIQALHQALLFVHKHTDSLTPDQHEALLAAARQRIQGDRMRGLPSLALVPSQDQEQGFCVEQCIAEVRTMARDAAASAAGDNSSSLAEVVAEAGPSCTSSPAAFRELLRDRSPIDEAVAARLFAAIARLHGGKTDLGNESSSQAALEAALAGLSMESGPGTPWKLDVIMACLNPELAKMSADRLAEQLDHDAFSLPDSRAFFVLMTCWRMATLEKPFPLATLIQKRWNNVQGQVAFLRYATAAPPKVFTFEHAQRKLAPVEGLQVIPLSHFPIESLRHVLIQSTAFLCCCGDTGYACVFLFCRCLSAHGMTMVVFLGQGSRSLVGTPNHAWMSLDLLSLLTSLYEEGLVPVVRQILELPLSQCPDVLVLGLASARRWGSSNTKLMDVQLFSILNRRFHSESSF